MKKIANLIVIMAFFNCLFIPLIFAQPQQGETLTITTYYPSPFGSYRELRSRRMAIGDTYFDGAQFGWPDQIPLPPGHIDQNADLVVEDNVGIGTVNPVSYLQTGQGNQVVALGTWADPAGGNCPAGTTWVDRDHDGLRENGECQTGRVGIGTTDPQRQLDVLGSVVLNSRGNPNDEVWIGGSPTHTVRSRVTVLGTVPNTGYVWAFQVADSSADIPYLAITNHDLSGRGPGDAHFYRDVTVEPLSRANSARFRVGHVFGESDLVVSEVNGNVGIGTDQPMIDLAIGDTDTGLQQQGDGQLGIFTNNIERIRIDPVGNVGIGTGLPQAMLDVRGAVYLQHENASPSNQAPIDTGIPARYLGGGDTTQLQMCPPGKFVCGIGQYSRVSDVDNIWPICCGKD